MFFIANPSCSFKSNQVSVVVNYLLFSRLLFDKDINKVEVLNTSLSLHLMTTVNSGPDMVTS